MISYYGYKIVTDKDPLLSTLYEDKTVNCFDLLENQYLLIVDESGQPVDRYKWQDGKHKNVYKKPVESQQMDKVKPKNPEQAFALDLLMDPTVTVKAITGNFGSGKAQPNTTMIPTPKGPVPLGELKPGDYVFDLHGHPTRILQVFPQGEMDCYEVTFSDGRIAYCNNQHLWSVCTSRGNLKTLTLQELMDAGLRTSTGQIRYKLPACSPVEYPYKDFSVDPYVIGVFLGDGCCKDTPLTLSSQDEDLVKEVAGLLGAVNYRRVCKKNWSWIFEAPQSWNTVHQKGVHPIKNFQTQDILPSEVIAGSGDKRIPAEYLYGSISQRWSLLQGLLDTDGTITKIKGRVSFSTTSTNLKNDVCQLVWSLGMRASVSIDNRSSKYHTGVCYHISITATREEKEKLFRLQRKVKIAQQLPSALHIHRNKMSIVSIHKLPRQEEMTCILVDNPERLYLTEQFVPTHNTYLSCCAAFQMLQATTYDKIVWIRNNIEVKDTNPIGALPGDYNEKMAVWAMPLADHLGGKEELNKLINFGKIEVEHLGFLRGRDIKHSVIFCSEAEHLTRDHVKLLLGRVAEGSILILEGDCRQIDKKAFEKDNGLFAAIDCLKGNRLFGYVHLQESVRSETAKLADLLDKEGN